MINGDTKDRLKKYNSRRDSTTIILIIVIIVGLVANAPSLYFVVTVIPILIIRWILSVKYKREVNSSY